MLAVGVAQEEEQNQWLMAVSYFSSTTTEELFAGFRLMLAVIWDLLVSLYPEKMRKALYCEPGA